MLSDSLRVIPVSCLLLLPFVDASLQEEETELSAPAELILEGPGGEVTRRPLVGLDLESLDLAKTPFLRFEGVEEETRPESDPLDAIEIQLVGGGRAFANLIGGMDEFLDVQLAGRSRLRLSIEEFASFRLPARFPQAWTEPVIPAESGDRLYRLSGAGVDRMDGTLEAFSPEGVAMDTALGIKTFPWAEVVALFVEALEEPTSSSDYPEVVVDLLDGSRLPLSLRGIGPDGLDLLTHAGRGLRLPLASVSEVFVVNGNVVFLSDLEPEETQATSPFGDDLGMVWPLRRDLSTSGSPLRAGGRLWTRGLGVHAPSRVAYTLDGTWKQLRGFVAVDDQVISLSATGSVIFRIKALEKVLWESPVLQGGAAPLAIPSLDLSGVESLVLEVDMADDLHLGDRADWLRLVLSR